MIKRILVVLLVILLISFISFEIKEDQLEKQTDYQKQIRNTYGYDVYYPHFDDYYITSIEITHHEKRDYEIQMDDDKDFLSIDYYKEKGELKGEEFNRQREKHFSNTDILYGVYEGKQFAMKVTYNNGEGDRAKRKSIKINGKKVKYKKGVNTETLYFYFDVNNGAYEIIFNLQVIPKDEVYDIMGRIIDKVS